MERCGYFNLDWFLLSYLFSIIHFQQQSWFSERNGECRRYTILGHTKGAPDVGLAIVEPFRFRARAYLASLAIRQTGD